jgi:hypothetical protein
MTKEQYYQMQRDFVDFYENIDFHDYYPDKDDYYADAPPDEGKLITEFKERMHGKIDAFVKTLEQNRGYKYCILNERVKTTDKKTEDKWCRRYERVDDIFFKMLEFNPDIFTWATDELRNTPPNTEFIKIELPNKPYTWNWKKINQETVTK